MSELETKTNPYKIFTYNGILEPWELRKARRTIERKASIQREIEKTRAAYVAVGLPIPPSLKDPTLLPLPLAINKIGGRKPSHARQVALATGQKTYMGAACKHGHSGLRYTLQSMCVECCRGRTQKKIRGTMRVTDNRDTLCAATATCAYCGRPYTPSTRRDAQLYCSQLCRQRARSLRRKTAA